MRGHHATLLRAVVLLGLSATLALAAPPYDFAGPWGGTLTARKSGATGTITADFTATANLRKFTGTVTLAAEGQTLSCAFTAKYRKNLLLHPRCAGRPASIVIVHFDPATQTLTGSFPVGRRHPEIVDFSLQRAPA
ncbi:MAG TPA: hypothetical protein VKW76_03960 [Candidatus Binatia bacterium]|nr:hypothetical protein [Candidatus Binatia bacterium]